MINPMFSTCSINVQAFNEQQIRPSEGDGLPDTIHQDLQFSFP
jgi:hypothetical protein